MNLRPPVLARDRVLVALPTPAIMRALFDDVAARRAGWIQRWAERLGGGDGPLPFVDLDAPDGSLDAILHRLEARGARRLFLLGARDQPGFAREIAARWPHAREDAVAPDLARDLAAVLHDEGAAPRELPDGRVLVPVDDEDPHVAIARLGRPARAYARDPARQAGALHGFLPPAALYGGGRGDELRAAWRAYWAELGLEATLRNAALGLDPALEDALRAERTTAAPTYRARAFVVTGIDGSGKSSHAAALSRGLAAEGATTAVLKLYRRRAFLVLADELSGRTARGAPMAAFRVSRIVKLCDSLRVFRDELAPALNERDAVVLDRYVETHIAAAGSQLGWDLEKSPFLGVFPPAERSFWLRLDAAEAVHRLVSRGDTLSADEHATGLTGYAESFAALATSPHDTVLDSRAPRDENARRIALEAGLRWPPAHDLGDAAFDPVAVHVVTTAGPTDRPPLRVVVGEANGPRLGAEIGALAALLRTELGAAADGVPTSVWLEAHAAQTVLDARTLTDPSPTYVVPLWPEALRRMPDLADLTMLGELGHMLAPLVEVTAWHPLTALDETSPWAFVAKTPAARARLNAAYNAALASLMRDR